MYNITTRKQGRTIVKVSWFSVFIYSFTEKWLSYQCCSLKFELQEQSLFFWFIWQSKTFKKRCPPSMSHISIFFQLLRFPLLSLLLPQFTHNTFLVNCTRWPNHRVHNYLNYYRLSADWTTDCTKPRSIPPVCNNAGTWQK